MNPPMNGHPKLIDQHCSTRKAQFGVSTHINAHTQQEQFKEKQANTSISGKTQQKQNIEFFCVVWNETHHFRYVV